MMMGVRCTGRLVLALVVGAAGPVRAEEKVEVAADVPAAGAEVDASIDRGVLIPTALTQPRGSLTYNNYELYLQGLTYAATNRVQVTVTLLPVLALFYTRVLAVGAVKARLMDAGAWHLAAQAAVGATYAEDDDKRGGRSNGFTDLGAFITACLRPDCASLLSAGATFQAALSSAADDELNMLLYGGSLLLRLADKVKLVAEVGAGGQGTPDRFQPWNGVATFAGVRLHGRGAAAELGVLTVFEGRRQHPAPFLSLSGRWRLVRPPALVE